MHVHEEDSAVRPVSRRVASRTLSGTSDVKESLASKRPHATNSSNSHMRLRSRSRDLEIPRSSDEEAETMAESGEVSEDSRVGKVKRPPGRPRKSKMIEE